MKYNNLGKSKLRVSSFCLGTMTFGEQTSENEAFKQIDKVLDFGINFIDTAELYPTCPLRDHTAGDTELIIGRWIKKNKNKRSNIILASKVVGKGYKAIRNGKPISANGIKIAIDDSLKRLNTDYIDLYQLHWPNRGSYHFRQNWIYDPSDQKKNAEIEDINSIVEVLYELKKSGKIREFGLSNETSWGTLQFINATKRYKDFHVASIQNEYSLLCRLFDTDMSEVSHNENIPLLAYSPLAGGVLTGKYLNNQTPKNSRLSILSGTFTRVNRNSLQAVKKYVQIAKKIDTNPTSLALAFCNQRPFMGSVIFGSTTLQQLDIILSGLNLILNKETIEEINEVYKNFPMTF